MTMKNYIRIFSLFVLAAWSASMYGQVALSSTTLSAAITDPASRTVVVASATGITIPGNGQNTTVLYVDDEEMVVNAVSGTTLTVQRGAGPTKSRLHQSGATVYFGPPKYFFERPSGSLRGGACTAANEIVLPQINVQTGDVFNCGAEGLWKQASQFSWYTFVLSGLNQPANSVATAAGTPLAVTGGVGSAQSATTGTGGAGAPITLTCGVGGVGGSSSGTGGAGGACAVVAGAGGGTVTGGAGGALNATAGAGGAGSTTAGAGGAATLAGGAAVTTVGTSGVGGVAAIVGGVGSPNTASAGTGGAGGATSQTGGAGGAASTGAATGGAGGAATLAGGAGGGTITGGAGGAVSVSGGVGANGSTAGGGGGAVTITAGAAGTGGNIVGSIITLVPGIPTGTGATGKVLIAGGTAASHLASTQTTAPVAGGSCTTPAVTAGSTDFRGQVSSASCTSGQTMTATFNKAYATAPFCVVSPANSAAAVTASAGAITFGSASTTVLTITSPAVSSTAGQWNYVCVE